MNAPGSLYLRVISIGLLGMIAGGLVGRFLFDGTSRSAFVLPWMLAAIFGVQLCYRAGFDAGKAKTGKNEK